MVRSTGWELVSTAWQCSRGKSPGFPVPPFAHLLNGEDESHPVSVTFTVICALTRLNPDGL